jgi:PST family polysaccharide transporter
MNEMKGKLAQGAIWIFASRVVVNLLSLVSTILLARLLTPEDFGLVAMATAVLTIVSAVTDLPVSSVLVQRDHVEDVHYDNCFSIGLLRGIIITIIFLLISYPVSILFKDSRLILLMVVLGLTSFIPNLNNPKLAIFTRDLVFWQALVMDASSKLIGLIVAAVIAIIYKSYWALVFGSLATQLVSLAISYILIPYLPRLNFSKFKEFFHYSIWLSMGQALQQFNWKLDQFLIGLFLGKSPLGIYTFADNLSNLPTREATMPIGRTLFPAFSRLKNDKEKLKRAFLLSQKILLAVALPIGFGFAAITPLLIKLAVGSKWDQAIPMIQIMSIVFAYITINTPTQHLAMALGETKNLFYRDIIYFAIRVPFIIAGMLMGGLMGIVYGRCISSVIGTFIVMNIAKKTIDASLLEQMLGSLRYLFAATLMFLGVSWLGNSEIIVGINDYLKITLQVLAGGIIYPVASLVLWLMLGRPSGAENEIFHYIKKYFKVA